MYKKFAIFGDPVEHSLSPVMHNSAFLAFGVNGIYFKEHLKDGSKLKERFFELNLSGANITVPHKEEAFKSADVLDEFAKKAKAVNTLVNRDGVLYGYNTDAAGFLNSIKRFKDIKNILILGAGGTAQSTSIFLKDAGYNVTILNRSEGRLKYFKDNGFNSYTFDNFKGGEFDLVVNMTSAGLKDENLPAPKEILEQVLPSAKGAVDIIYGKETPFLKMAKEFNLEVADGKDMLIEQGVLAFDYFTGQQFHLDDIRNIMRESLESF
jgi:shikimate dehydrogenase